MSRILLKTPVIGEPRDRKLLERASSYIYSQTLHGDLAAHVFQPDTKAVTPRPLVVFFHGGLWDTPMLAQFAPQCHHLTSRGAVAAIVETRVSSKHGTTPLEAVDDAREVIRWLRLHAAVLHIDPHRVTAAGAAGGALLALLTAMPKDKRLPAVDGVSCRPQALMLYSAVVNTRSNASIAARFSGSKSAKALNPSSMVRSKLPPMLFLHGTNDRVASFAEVKRFRRRLRWRGNTCELASFGEADHAFFNFNVDHERFELSTAIACRFLTGLGLLDTATAEPL